MNASHKNKKELLIFVATDEEEFLKYMIETYGEQRVKSLKEAPRVSRDDEKALMNGMHKDERFSPLLKGKSAVLDMLVLSKAKRIINNISSLSLASFVMSSTADSLTHIVGEEVFECTKREGCAHMRGEYN